MRLAGITGKPNVGKSTFFSAATLTMVKIANYPFTTIEPNVGVAYVRKKCVCRELGVKDNPVNSLCTGTDRLIPVKLVDLPGLVPGAHQGRGLGNRFLSEISNSDVLIHVVDASGGTDEEGRPVKPGTRDPLLDMVFLEQEYEKWMQQIISRDWAKIARQAEQSRRRADELLAEKLAGLGISRERVAGAIEASGLDAEKPASWGDSGLEALSKELRRRAKPIVTAANKADTEEAASNIERIRGMGLDVVPTSAESELVLRRAEAKGLIEYTPGDGHFKIKGSLTDEQRRALKLVEEKVLARWGSTGVQEVLNKSYFEVLGMIAVYPVEDPNKMTDHDGNVLPDVYLVPRGTNARELAYKIHSDLGKRFLYAVDGRTKMRLGEDHVLEDGDVVSVVSAA
ncbi:MAG: redox-regulated ATPase YchF [Candidatus Brockarchaeota archaeon]|nr:redox-regulated ATPase YchF [Candidatus Brockarchaeota archaeon]